MGVRKNRRRERPEARWQRTVTDYLNRREGWLVLDTSHVGLYQAPSGAFVKIGIKGQPDLVALYRGHGIGLELKSRTGTEEKEQKACAEAWGKLGTIVFKLKADDWDALGVAIAWAEEGQIP